MLIGLTYDLRSAYLAMGYGEEETAEFDRDDTIDSLEAALRQLGHQTERIGHAKELVARLAKGDRWDLVFNIAEGMHGPGREAVVPALLDLYQIEYTFSDPLVMALSLHKGYTKDVLRPAGVPTPEAALVHTKADVESIRLPYPLFAKPVAEGTGKGIGPTSKITSPEALRTVCSDLLAKFRQPVLVETFLSGREFTVGITGTGDEAAVVATMEIILLAQAEPEVYSYVNKERCEELVEYRIVSGENDAEVREAEALSLRAWRALGCRDAGRIDVRSDAHGRPHFIEVNPLAGLHPEHSDLPILSGKVGVSYQELIERIVKSAAKRVEGAGGRGSGAGTENTD